MSHLTDEQLQAFLDGTAADAAAVQEHLDSCPNCRLALDEYKALFSRLDSEPEFPLSASFADLVMEKLPDIEFVPVNESPLVSDKIIMFATVAVMIAVGLYFLDVASLIKPLFGWVEAKDAQAVQTYNSLRQQASGMGNLPMMIFMTVLTIACIAGVDKLIKARRQHSGFRTFVA
ncbi:MAG: zf-HC2 domain-containing protein [Candidatus Zixiibacteriota bacterium]